MKKLFLATACAVASGTIYAKNTTEQRIQALESQLQQLKSELEQQKTSQTELQLNPTTVITTVEEKVVAQTQPTPSSLADNIHMYGIIRLDGAIDFKSSPTARGRTINQINKAPFEQPDSIRSDFTVAASRIGFDIKDLGGNSNIKAKIEADFWVNNGKGDGSLRLRHAYLHGYNWIFGQTWSLMSNPEIITESVDYSLLLGGSVLRTPQVQYIWQFNPEHKLHMGLEYLGFQGERSSGLPALTSKYVYQSGAMHLLAQGFINEKQAQSEQGDINKIGWGVGVGGRYKFNPQNSIQANYFHVTGDQRIASYVAQGSTSDGTAWGGDFSVDLDRERLLLNTFDSILIGYTHKFNDQWRSNVAASMVRFDDDSAYAKANPSSNKQLSDIVINGFYSPQPHIDLGAEYHHGKRKTFDHQQADVSRINLSARYKF